ncbi:MAG: NB-ARC domain-containing protein, partial [Flammeovirgaceae bacterium]
MHPTIVIALNFLENGNYVDYFEALDPLVPPQLKTIYAEHKGKFMADQKPFNFFQQLSVFAKEVARYLAESEEEAPADLPKHLLDEPFRPPIFLGRTNELQQLHDQLFDTSQDQTSIALISGSGGIGKTTFAINYYHKYADKYHHLAWLLAEPNLETALLNLAASLKVDYEECMNNHQRIKMLTKVLASLEKPCLLIIDHATSLKQLEQQFLTLNSIGHFHVLITTRLTQFKKLPIVELGPLDKEPALELFKTYYEAFEDEEETLFYEVCDAVRGNTLLIELMAKNLNHFNTELKKRYPLATLVADLHQSLLTIQKSDEVSTTYQAKGLGLRTESIQSIVLAMYDLSELTTKENRVLSALAMLPAEDIPFSLLDQLLSKEGEEDDVDHTLLSLAKKGLVEYNKQEKSFKCSPLIQEIIRHKNKTQLLTNGKVLLESLSQELDYQGGFGNLSNNSYQKAVTLVHYGDYLINHTQALWEDSPLEIQYFIAQLCERLANFYKISGNIALALDYLSSYQKLMHELCNAHPDLHDYKYKLAYGHELT